MKRSLLARLYVYLAIPLIVGVSLYSYTYYNGTCAYPCGVIHPYRPLGYAVTLATVAAYVGLTVYSRRSPKPLG